MWTCQHGSLLYVGEPQRETVGDEGKTGVKGKGSGEGKGCVEGKG